jgi:hypothetical protein
MKALITLNQIGRLEDDKVHLSGSVPVLLLMSLFPAHPLPVLNPVKENWGPRQRQSVIENLSTAAFYHFSKVSVHA